MPKLYFRYAVMNAGKSTALLQIAHDYEENNKLRILVLKPSIDKKGKDYIVSRMSGGEIKRKCDFLITPDMDLLERVSEVMPSIVLIDEAQFLTRRNVEDLVEIVTQIDIPVICFGLKCTFEGKPFEGSSWLFALAEDIEELTTRALNKEGDGKRATMNLRLVNGKPVFEGETIGIDGEDEVTYVPVSLKTYMRYKKSWLAERK